MKSVPVLVVGGGPVGLTMSLALSQLDVRSLLVERHSGTAILPKARGINTRTMEVFRQLGVEADIRAVGTNPKFGRMIVWVESLSGKEINRLHPNRGAARALSPTTRCGCAQDILEPVLRRHASALDPDALLFNTELIDLQQSESGVVGTIRNRATEQTGKVSARYAIAADGAHSPLRNALGIERTGERDIYDSVNIHCRVNLADYVDHRPAGLYFVEQPDLRGTFLTINGSDRWGFLVHSLSEYGFTKDNLTPERCVELVRKAAGLPDVPVEVLGINFWKCSAMVSDTFRKGNVFLIGDAAHETTPSGGFGLNLGIQDVHNFAWKMAAVVKGQADPSLLDTYDAERRPHTTEVVQATLLNMKSFDRAKRQSGPVLPRKEFLNEQGLVFGARYDSAAVIPDGSKPPPVNDPVTDYAPSATPGCRAPHAEIECSGERRSTIDLFGRGFVLLATRGGAAWREAASRADIPVTVLVDSEDFRDAGGKWTDVYEVSDGGAVLVRPDGVVGWRCQKRPADHSVLAEALQSLLGRKFAVHAA